MMTRLAGHQARHRVDGADAAGVGQRGGDAGEVVHRQLAVAGAADDVLVGLPELEEVQRLGLLDGRDDELAVAVGLHQVDGQAEVDVLRLDQGRLAVLLREGVVHRRHGLEGLHHRVADEVREGDLPAAGALEVVVDDDAVVEQQLHRDRAHGGGRGQLQRGVHVLRHGGGRAAQRHELRAVGGAGRARRRPAAWRRGRRRAAAGRGSAGAAARGPGRGSARARRPRAAAGAGRRGRRGAEPRGRPWASAVVAAAAPRPRYPPLAVGAAAACRPGL